MKYQIKWTLSLLLFFQAIVAFAQTDPLPSWNSGAVKQNIIKFVTDVTSPQSSQFVPPTARIATIDNDGTLWLEQPIYTQAIFAFDEVKKMAPQHPEWKTQQPFKAILTNDQAILANLTSKDYGQIIAVTHSGMTPEAFKKRVAAWLATTKNPRFKKPYTQLVYQPMLELLNYLRANGFKIYIVSGGGQDFVRAFAEKVYGVPPEQVIGTTEKTNYNYQNGKASLTKQPELFMVSNYDGKPEAINLIIGRYPVIAIGNSTGDQQMLEYTQSNLGPHFEMLIHHDDAAREYAYGPNSKVGTFSAALMQEAKSNGWNVVSMKNDWKVIFP